MVAQIEKAQIRTQDFFEKYGITVVTDSEVTEVDYKKQTLHFMGNGSLGYDKLLIASGGTPNRMLKCEDDSKIFRLRTFDDMNQIREAAKDAKNILIVGGSFIGLETASALKGSLKEKANVTVVDIAKIPFEKSLGEKVGKGLQELHETNGVKFQLGKSVKNVSKSGNGYSVELSDGSKVEADIIIEGLGVSVKP